MKKILSFFLMTALFFSFIPVVSAAQTGKYIVIKDTASVYSSYSTTSKKIAEVYKKTYLDVTAVSNNGMFGKVRVPSADVIGWVQLGALSYIPPKTENTDITGIKIKSAPKKLTYTDREEELDLTGLSVVSIDKKGGETPVTAYNVYAPVLKLNGDSDEQKTVTVTYSPDSVNTFTASFFVTVIRQKVSSLTVKTQPKCDYMENGILDLSGLSLLLSFPDSSKNKVYTYEEIKSDPDFIIKGCHSEEHGAALKKGTHTLTIAYRYSDITCTVSLNVQPRRLIELKIKQMPENLTVYDNTVKPSIEGLILEASYDNGEKEDVPYYNCVTQCDPSLFAIGPGNKVRVYFGELFVDIDFTYSIAIPQDISLEYPADFLYPPKGEEIDLSQIKVKLIYSDKTFEYVKDFSITGVDYQKIDSPQTVEIRYKEHYKKVTITITSRWSKGDITGDGIISSADARQALRHAVRLTALGGKQIFAGDADRDGRIDSADARLILRAAVGLENLYITLK